MEIKQVVSLNTLLEQFNAKIRNLNKQIQVHNERIYSFEETVFDTVTVCEYTRLQEDYEKSKELDFQLTIEHNTWEHARELLLDILYK